MSHHNHITQLIQKSKRGKATTEEITLLLQLIRENPKHPALLERFKNLGSILQEVKVYENTKAAGMVDKVWDKWQKVKPLPGSKAIN